MSRSTAALALTALALLSSASAARSQAPPPPTPVPCVSALGAEAAVAVDANAVADPACLTIRKGKTRIAWTAAADVRLLVVAFKAPATGSAPDDPACAGARCVLDKAKHALKQGEFAYSVVVVRQDGSTAAVDPKLIIQP